jgi:hypothetical protein
METVRGWRTVTCPDVCTEGQTAHKGMEAEDNLGVAIWL